jgi:hypothetical protein
MDEQKFIQCLATLNKGDQIILTKKKDLGQDYFYTTEVVGSVSIFAEDREDILDTLKSYYSLKYQQSEAAIMAASDTTELKSVVKTIKASSNGGSLYSLDTGSSSIWHLTSAELPDGSLNAHKEQRYMLFAPTEQKAFKFFSTRNGAKKEIKKSDLPPEAVSNLPKKKDEMSFFWSYYISSKNIEQIVICSTGEVFE